MSALYIQVKDGTTVDHPVLEQNLIEVFGEIPDNYKPFVRVPCPDSSTLGVFQKFAETYDTPNYQQTDGVWKDTWTVIDMTQEERDAKIAVVQAMQPVFPSWTFSAENCVWSAPVSRPVEGGPYAWNEVKQSWALAPTTDVPAVGGPYAWNLDEQRWVQAPQDDNTYAWSIVTQTWIVKPTDGEYIFNMQTQQWVAAMNPPTPT